MANSSLELKDPAGPIDRKLFALDASTAADLVKAIPLDSAHFALFLAWDAASVSAEEIAVLATELHKRGLAYLCAWGPGCERVHDIFDEVEIELEAGRPSDSVIMTTWHADEPMEEGLWFFVYNSFPDRAYEETCRIGIAATIGSDSWAASVAKYLGDLGRLNAMVKA